MFYFILFTSIAFSTSFASLVNFSWDSSHEYTIGIIGNSTEIITLSSVGGNYEQLVFKKQSGSTTKKKTITTSSSTSKTASLVSLSSKKSIVIVNDVVYTITHSTMNITSKQLNISKTSPVAYSPSIQRFYVCSTDNLVLGINEELAIVDNYNVTCGSRLAIGKNTIAIKDWNGSIRLYSIQVKGLKLIKTVQPTVNKSESYLNDPIILSVFDTLYAVATDNNTLSSFISADNYTHETVINDIPFYNKSSTERYNTSYVNNIQTYGNLVMLGLPWLSSNKGGAVLLFDNVLTTRSKRFVKLWNITLTSSQFNGISLLFNKQTAYLGNLVESGKDITTLKLPTLPCDDQCYCPSGWTYLNKKCYDVPSTETLPYKILRIFVILLVILTLIVAMFLLFDYTTTPAPHPPDAFPIEVNFSSQSSNTSAVLVNNSLSSQQLIATILPNGEVQPSIFSLSPNESVCLDIITNEQDAALLLEVVQSGTSINRTNSYTLPTLSNDVLMQNKSLLNVLKGTDKEKLKILINCALALQEYIEQSPKSYHGSLTPKSFIIDKDNTVKLLDRKRMIGEECYSSPEQVDSLELDGYSDVYSFAVVLNEVICKEQPYGEYMNKFDMYDAIKTGVVPRINENTRDDLLVVFTNCWKEKDLRWNIEQVVLALQTIYDSMNDDDTFVKNVSVGNVITLLGDGL
ncbi:Protein kinase domain-containing protein [Entamoeba marina]